MYLLGYGADLPELEIIIINDGSIDESGKILRKLRRKTAGLFC